MIGNKLKELRAAANKTQADVANHLGISRASYSHFENNRNEPDNVTLSKLADFFEVTTDFLLDHNTNNKTSSELRLTPRTALDHIFSADGKQISDEDKDALERIINTYIQSRD